MDAGGDELNEIEVANPEQDGAYGGEPDVGQRQDAPQVITTVTVPYHV